MTDYSPYEILGVDPAADEAEIRAAYRRAVRMTHPDAGGTAGMFGLVRGAYELLIDPGRRAHYDATSRPSGADDATTWPEPEWGEEATVDDAGLDAEADDHPAPPVPQDRWWPFWSAVGRLVSFAGAVALAWYLLQPIVTGGSYKPDAAGPDLFGRAEDMGLVVVAAVAYVVCVVASLVGYYLAGLWLLSVSGFVALVAWPFVYWSPATAEERWHWASWLGAFALYQILLTFLADRRWDAAKDERAAEEA